MGERSDAPGSSRRTERERFRGEDRQGGERGYRGRRGEGVPPGPVPGGSYGGGGGYRQGGYEIGGEEWERAGPSDYAEGGYYGQGERGGWGRPPGFRQRGGGGDREGGYHAEVERGAGPDRMRRDRGGPESRGDWRRGYGGYGMSGGEPAWGGSGDFGDEGGWGGGGTDPRETGLHEEEERYLERGAERQRGTARQNATWMRMEPWSVPGRYTGVGPADYRRSAEAIRDEVCERLTRHGELDASGIRVHVERDEVVLDGVVPDRRAKRMAEDTAESVSGVHDVHNRLRIRREAEGDRTGAI